MPLSSAPSRRQAGFTLVELMVSMTIGLFLVGAIATLIAQTSNSRAELDKSNQQIENGRYALSLLKEDIQHAGFYGQYVGGFTTPTALPNPCATSAASIDAALALPLQGYTAPTSVPSPLSSCLPDANHISGTDILVVRRLEANDTLPTLATAVAGQVYVQTTPGARITAVGPDPTPSEPSVYLLKKKDGTTPADLRRYVAHIYFLSPCNRYASGATRCTSAADNGRPVPTLKRLELALTSSGTLGWKTVPLVDGIQNLQFDYVRDSVGDGTPVGNFVTSPTLAQWPTVMAVRINLLARNVIASPGYVDRKTYNLGTAGSVGPFSDNFKRHAYSEVVRVINPSSQRE